MSNICCIKPKNLKQPLFGNVKIPPSGGGKELMLKVVVFDSGYGGELFADYLQENLPVIQIIRVIDWRNSKKINTKYREARKITEIAIKPYIGRVDLIIFANHLLTITSLKYFKRKYQTQKFLGLDFEQPNYCNERDTIVLTTKAVARTINYHNYLFRLKCKTKTLVLDNWPAKIDSGELAASEIINTLQTFSNREQLYPKNVILACSHFNDLKPELRICFGGNLKIYDGFENTFRKICKALELRGGTGKKKS